MRGDPVPSFLLREAKNRVARPTELESAHFLEIFAFTKQRSTNQVIQARTRKYRCAVDIRLDTCSGGLHVCERGIWRHEPSFDGYYLRPGPDGRHGAARACQMHGVNLPGLAQRRQRA